ncbi:MAG: hypothetical protein LUE21_03270, partial [Oscillospiraceae bacterium]|nr:hypothetical protein [Oscillospiraceae bacterium]
MKKVLSILLCICLLCGAAVSAFASSEASGEASGDAVANGAADMNATGNAAITVTDEGVTEDAESASVTIEYAEGGVISDDVISGVKLTSEDNDAGGILV